MLAEKKYKICSDTEEYVKGKIVFPKKCKILKELVELKCVLCKENKGNI